MSDKTYIEEFKQKLEQLCTVYGVVMFIEDSDWKYAQHIAVSKIDSEEISLRFDSVEFDPIKGVAVLQEAE